MPLSNPLRLALGCIAGLTLTACDVVGVPGLPAVSFTELLNDGTQLDLEIINAQPTPVTDMPTTGSAQYVGAAAFGASAPSSFSGADSVARVTIDADFQANSLDGSIDNFRGLGGDELEGSIAIQNGLVVGNTMVASLDGAITEPSSSSTADFTGTMAGGFEGDTGQFITGGITGEFSNGINTVDAFALFHTRRQ